MIFKLRESRRERRAEEVLRRAVHCCIVGSGCCDGIGIWISSAVEEERLLDESLLLLLDRSRCVVFVVEGMFRAWRRAGMISDGESLSGPFLASITHIRAWS